MTQPPVGGPLEVLRSEQHLLVGTEWVVSGRVRLRRRIVTERRTIEVDVRREVIELAGDDLDFHDGRLIGTAVDGAPVAAPAPSPPFVAVLREEIPRVVFDVRPYERLTATTIRVDGEVTVGDVVAHEQVDVVTTPSARPATS